MWTPRNSKVLQDLMQSRGVSENRRPPKRSWKDDGKPKTPVLNATTATTPVSITHRNKAAARRSALKKEPVEVKENMATAVQKVERGATTGTDTEKASNVKKEDVPKPDARQTHQTRQLFADNDIDLADTSSSHDTITVEEGETQAGQQIKMAFTHKGQWSAIGSSSLLYNYNTGLANPPDMQKRAIEMFKRNKKPICAEEWISLASKFHGNDKNSEMMCAGMASLVLLINMDRETNTPFVRKLTDYEDNAFDFDRADRDSILITTPSKFNFKITDAVSTYGISRCATKNVDFVCRKITSEVAHFMANHDVFMPAYSVSQSKNRCQYIPLGNSVFQGIEKFVKLGLNLDSNMVRNVRGQEVRIASLCTSTLENFINRIRHECDQKEESGTSLNLAEILRKRLRWPGNRTNFSPPALRRYVATTRAANAVLVVFLPLILLVTLNVMLLYYVKKRSFFMYASLGKVSARMRKSGEVALPFVATLFRRHSDQILQQKTEHRVAVTVCAVVTSFTITQAPSAVVLTVNSLWQEAMKESFNSQWYHLTTIISFLVVIGKSLNFVVFCLSSSSFRRRLFNILRSKYGSREEKLAIYKYSNVRNR